MAPRKVAIIKAITKQAILYWNKLLRGKIEVPLPTAEEDVFGRLPARYQITWHAFLRLSVMKIIEEIYPPVKVSSPPEAFAATGEIDGTIRNVSLSGIDPEIDPQLADTLAAVQSGEIGYFYSHSLKHITRNPEKLFRVIEAVLASNAGVVTPNYLITNGRVYRRAKLLKPSDQDIIAQMTNYQEISAEHKSALLDTYRSLQE